MVYAYMSRNRDKLLDRVAFTDKPLSAKLTDNGSYIVYSYETPIAVCIRGRWFIHRKVHSTLTTMHQMWVKRTLGEEELEVRLSNPEQFNDVLNAANA